MTSYKNMTEQQIADYIAASLGNQMKARGDFYKARMEYARAIGGGCATEQMRRRVVALKEAYEATA
jgi:hypothetical protein